ncbi:MAG: hypothetical protein E7376_05070 [Clostridiales bacterium]|nr:hypothetical protein [Clostridiales bacterium]
MFVKKVDVKKIETYFKDKWQISVKATKKPYGIHLKFLLDSHGPTPEYTLTDYDVVPLNSFAKLNYIATKDCWKSFLLEEFKDEYKDAFNKQLTEAYEKEIIK